MQRFNPNKTRLLGITNRLLKLILHNEKHSCEKINIPSLKNILVVDLTMIGDTVMLQPFFRIIKKNNSNVKITMVCNAWGKDILYDQNLVDEFIVIDWKWLKSPKNIFKNLIKINGVIKIINKKIYDLGIETRGDLRFIFLLHFCECKRKAAYSYSGGNFLLTDIIKPMPEGTHLLLEKANILMDLGFHVSKGDLIPCFRITSKERDYLKVYKSKNYLTGKIIIGIHPGASRKNKQWKGFSTLVQMLENEYADLYFLIFKGPGESEAVSAVEKKCKELKVSFLVVEETMRKYKLILSICDIVICNDSGAGHIADAYGVKTYVIFGPVLPEIAHPYSKKSIFISNKEVSCSPCTFDICPKSSIECLEKIKSEEVFARIKETWNILEA